MTSKKLIAGIVFIIVFFVIIFASLRNDNSSSSLRDSNIDSVSGDSQGSDDSLNNLNSERTDWRVAELKDVRTGETFTIQEFSDKPVLLESFAVWCPKCKRQQEEIKKLHQELGDSFVSISLDTDENEDEAKVKSFITENGFDWYYAVSPTNITQSLIKEFGIEIVNAPSTPVILICPDGIAIKLPSGIKDVSELKKEITEC